ncbi:MAG: helix-turn-helix domain-containing protein [Chelatococcus sp.]|nr:helix-turn-helix domain-containing protein [Chelatococcus sp. HY11]MBX3539870.1 helix-turn-helix domain-containing protein [Chelatococcus sp.]MBX3545322.1 helix-turn-helix domain-containing protein [Chelatococcus sp.]CAH1660592.1 Regulatory Fis family protein [Hyphomicrobiales bacterium]CAH1683374.1 Regulatory Fis family protein [Hyphomicrobiales bacterium]
MPLASLGSSWGKGTGRGQSSGTISKLAPSSQPEDHPFVGATVAEVEQGLILATLDYCEGNRTSAARILGISLRSLHNKLTSYNAAGMSVPAPRPRTR